MLVVVVVRGRTVLVAVQAVPQVGEQLVQDVVQLVAEKGEQLDEGAQEASSHPGDQSSPASCVARCPDHRPPIITLANGGTTAGKLSNRCLREGMDVTENWTSEITPPGGKSSCSDSGAEVVLGKVRVVEVGKGIEEEDDGDAKTISSSSAGGAGHCKHSKVEVEEGVEEEDEKAA